MDSLATVPIRTNFGTVQFMQYLTVGYTKAPVLYFASSRIYYYLDGSSNDLGNILGIKGMVSYDGKKFYFIINNAISIYKQSGTTYSPTSVGSSLSA